MYYIYRSMGDGNLGEFQMLLVIVSVGNCLLVAAEFPSGCQLFVHYFSTQRSLIYIHNCAAYKNKRLCQESWGESKDCV